MPPSPSVTPGRKQALSAVMRHSIVQRRILMPFVTLFYRTRSLNEVCRQADILVAAVGRPEMVKGKCLSSPVPTCLQLFIDPLLNFFFVLIRRLGQARRRSNWLWHQRDPWPDQEKWTASRGWRRLFSSIGSSFVSYARPWRRWSNDCCLATQEYPRECQEDGLIVCKNSFLKT